MVAMLESIYGVATGDREFYVTGARMKDFNALLKAVAGTLTPRVIGKEELGQFVYGYPYILEIVLSDGEHRMMYGLYSHQGIGGIFDFRTVNTLMRLYDVHYGVIWRCWTGVPSVEQRAAEPWKKVTANA